MIYRAHTFGLTSRTIALSVNCVYDRLNSSDAQTLLIVSQAILNILSFSDWGIFRCKALIILYQFILWPNSRDPTCSRASQIVRMGK